jgi:hypothetical protein
MLGEGNARRDRDLRYSLVLLPDPPPIIGGGNFGSGTKVRGWRARETAPLLRGKFCLDMKWECCILYLC